MHQVDGQDVVALSVAAPGPKGVYPRSVVDAAPEEVRLGAALHLHDEAAATGVGAAQIHARGLARERQPGYLGRGVLEVLHRPVGREEGVEHADEYGLVRRVAQQRLESRVRQRVNINLA